jgi:hypothetical protein
MRCPNTADEVLAWLNACAVRVDFQDLGTRVLREKNRVIVQYRVSSGVAAVGGRDLRAAVLEAAMRTEHGEDNRHRGSKLPFVRE